MSPATITATGISHVSLRVSDAARAVRWYHAAFGYEVLRDGPAPTPDRTRSVIGVICGGTLAVALLETPDGKPRTEETLGIVGLSLTVPDIVAAVAAAEAAGLNPTPVIEAEDWKVAFMSDPDGNIVELVMQPRGASSIADFAPTLRSRIGAEAKR